MACQKVGGAARDKEAKQSEVRRVFFVSATAFLLFINISPIALCLPHQDSVVLGHIRGERRDR